MATAAECRGTSVTTANRASERGQRPYLVISCAFAAEALCTFSGFVDAKAVEDDMFIPSLGYEAEIGSLRISANKPAEAKFGHRARRMHSTGFDEHVPDMLYSIHLPIADVHAERARMMHIPTGSYCRISLSTDLFSDRVTDSRSEVMYVASGRPVFKQRWSLQADGALRLSGTQAWTYSEEGIFEKSSDGDGDLLVSGASDSLSQFRYVDGLLVELVQLKPTGSGAFNSDVVHQLEYRSGTLVRRDVLSSSSFSRPVLSYVYEHDSATIVAMAEYGDIEHHELITAEKYRWDESRLIEVRRERDGELAVDIFEYDEEGRRSVQSQIVDDKSVVQMRWFYDREGAVYPALVESYRHGELTDAISYTYDAKGRVIGQISEHLGAWTHTASVSYSPECESISEFEVGWPCFNPASCLRLDPLWFWP